MDDDVEELAETGEIPSEPVIDAATGDVVVEAVGVGVADDVEAEAVEDATEAAAAAEVEVELVCANRLLKLCDSSKQMFFHR